jgi:hypothetical protein
LNLIWVIPTQGYFESLPGGVGFFIGEKYAYFAEWTSGRNQCLVQPVFQASFSRLSGCLNIDVCESLQGTIVMLGYMYKAFTVCINNIQEGQNEQYF